MVFTAYYCQYSLYLIHRFTHSKSQMTYHRFTSSSILLLLWLEVCSPFELGHRILFGGPPCPLGPLQEDLQATMAVAVTPSHTKACGKDFMISMDGKNKEPSVVLLSFDSPVRTKPMPAVLEVFVNADSRHFGAQNITVFAFNMENDMHDGDGNLSWQSLKNVLKPFDSSDNQMKTCSDNIVNQNNLFRLGKTQFPDSELVSDQGGLGVKIDVSKAIKRGLYSFALVRMIDCGKTPFDKPDVPVGNIILSSLCNNDTDWHGQQYPPRIVFGPLPTPPQCVFKRGYYHILSELLDPVTDRLQNYLLKHSLKSKDKKLYITSKLSHGPSKYKLMWKLNKDTLSDTPTTFFGIKRKSAYSYLGGTSGGMPALGTKEDTMRIIPLQLKCFQVNCNRVFLVSNARKKQGKPAYLTMIPESKSNKNVSWKYSWQGGIWNGLFQLIRITITF